MSLIFNFKKLKFEINDKKVEKHFIGNLSFDLLKNNKENIASTDKGMSCLTGLIIKTLTGHTNEVLSLAVLRDGTLASGSSDKTIRIWNVTSGLTIKTLTGHTNSVSSLAVLQDGTLASGSADNTIRIWNVTNRSTIKTLTGHTNQVYSLAVLRDGTVASGSRDGTIRFGM